jgi:cytochrome c553
MKRKQCLLITILILAGFYVTGVQAAGDAEAGKQKSEPCVACHGVGGVSANPAWPKLAGQGEKYLVDQLQLFKEKVRVNTLMNPQAENLSEQDIEDLAAYYASQAISVDSADPDKEFQGEKLHLIGERIYRGGNTETGVPACMSCHAPDGVGNGPAKFPQLAGQHAVYTAAQLRAYRSGARYQPDDNLNMMKDIATYLSDTEIDAVAEYIAGLH